MKFGSVESSISWFCRGLIAVLFISLIIAASLQVVSRFVFNKPIFWTDEVCVFSMVWMGMIGSAYAVRSGSHIRVDLLPKVLSPKAAKTLYRALLFFVMFFAVIMIYSGGDFVARNMKQMSASLGVPMGYVYLCFPLSGVLMLYYALLEFFGKEVTA
jgi:TRAP-type C4-dicarboxylate transport system permease small subunit